MSWLKDRLEEASAQLNMSDGGKTAATVRRTRAQAQPAQTVRRANRSVTLNSVGTGVGLGAVRSGVGLAQGFSGLYDLASPGTGTSRFSKKLDNAAKFTDQTAKNEGVPTVAYKGGQAVTDALTFAAGGAIAKTASKAPTVTRALKPAQMVTKPIYSQIDRTAAAMAKSGAKGRIASRTLKGFTNPANNAANVAMTANFAGQNASKGRDTSPRSVATDLALGTAFNAGLPFAGAVAREIPGATRGAARKAASTMEHPQVAALNAKKQESIRAMDRSNPRMMQYHVQNVNNIDSQIRAIQQRGGAKAGDILPDKAFPKQPKASSKGSIAPEATGDKIVDNHPKKQIVNMSPDEYLKQAFENTDGKLGGSYESWLSSNRHDPQVAKQYAEAMSRGDKFPTAYIDKERGMQDGRNRALAAKLNGDKTMPVAVIPERTPAENVAFYQSELDKATTPYMKHHMQKKLDLAKSKAQPTQVATIPEPVDVRPDAVERVMAQNPMKPGFKPENPTDIATAPLIKTSPVVKEERLVKNLGRQPTYSERAAMDAYLETGSRDSAIRAYTDTFAQRGMLYGGERRAGSNVERVIKAMDAADAPQPIRITGRAGEKQVPVSKVEQDGRVVKKTNLKTGKEKRFSVDENGELLPDTKGAYRLFTNDEGHVTQFRIGDEVFDAKSLGDLSDLNGYGSSLASMRRNVERGFGKDTGEKVNQFLVDHQQAQATKLIGRQVALKEGMKAISDDLGISFGVGRHKAKKVSAAIQDFGEGKKNKAQLVQEFGAEKAGKIIAADKWFRSQYDTLLNEMNDTLTKYGYDPVPKRRNYYTHFQEPSLWSSFGLKMQELSALGSPTMQDALPEATRGKVFNKLAGETEFTQPNKRFNPFAQRREGEAHTSDAFQAFERYITPTLNNIYMTPSITRARVLSKAIAQEADTVGKDANKTIIQIKEWANNLAGKSNRIDRPLVDSNWGNKYLKATQWMQKKVGQNTIVGNLSTALLQPIVLSQTTGKFGMKNTLLAAAQEMSVGHGSNAAIRNSSFMARRYADLTPITAGKVERSRNVANTPLRVVEETAARITWNAAHNDALSKGLKGKQAIHYADVEAEKTLSGRSIGEKPELFRSKAASPGTMFQLEVNNFWQQFGKEMTKGQAAKTLVAAFAFNLMLEQATGKNVGFNPIDAAIDSYRDISDDTLSPKEKAIKTGQRFAGEFVDNTPIIAPVANATLGDKSLRKLLGESSNAGRFGVSSPVSALVSNPWYAVSPFGGAQAKKTLDGAKTLANNALTDKNGDITAQVDGSNAANKARGLLFGKSAIPEVRDYYDSIGKKGGQKTGDKSIDKVLAEEQKNETDYKNALKKSLGARDFKLSTLDGNDRQKLIDGGLVSQDELDRIDERASDIKSKYGQNSPVDTKIKNDSAAIKFVTARKNLKEEDVENWRKQDVGETGKKLVDRASALKPDGFPDLPHTNAVAEEYTKLLEKRAKGGMSKLEDNEAKKEFLKNAYSSNYDDDVKDIRTLGKNDTLDAIDNGLLDQDKLDKAIEMDNLLDELGLSTAKISKSLRETLGYNYAGSQVGKGRSASRGGKKKASKFSFADIYKPQISNDKALRKLVEEATLRQKSGKA